MAGGGFLDARSVLVSFLLRGYRRPTTDDSEPVTAPAGERLMPASADDLANPLAFPLRFKGRKRKHDADEIMSAIIAKRLVDHLSALVSSS